jgi:ankyrin repeat protein
VLLYAIALNNYEATKKLLEQGADPNLCGRDGETPLIHATRKSCSKAMTLLLKKGADPNKANHEGLTPLFIAGRKKFDKGIMILLWNKGAEADIEHMKDVFLDGDGELEDLRPVSAYIEKVQEQN